MNSTLRRQPSGRWAIAWPGLEPVTIRKGEVFLLEVGGKMERTRMEHRLGRYYTIDGYLLADGLRAAFFDQRERNAKPLSTDLGPSARPGSL